MVDVGKGFIDVNAEQLILIIKKLSLNENFKIDSNIASIWICDPLKIPICTKQIKLIGTVSQFFMKIHNIFIFRPIMNIEREIIETINKKCVKFRKIYKKAFRGLYISDKEKRDLKPGSILWVDKVPYVSQNGFYIKKIQKITLKNKWMKKAEEIMKPRLFFKVLRGKNWFVMRMWKENY